MKFAFCITLFVLQFISVYSQKLTSALLRQLEENEKNMFAAVSNGDSTAFKTLAGNEYFSINADGTSENLKQTLAGFGKFKGATSTLSEQQQRMFNNVALRTGKATFYFEKKVVAEVLYTSGWVYRNNKWQFIHWQGTLKNMTPPIPNISNQ